MIVYQPRQIALPDGSPSGRWHVVGESDETGIGFAACSCPDAHESPEAARACHEALACLAREGIKRSPPPSVADLAALAFGAYNDHAGGKTWDGKPIPSWETIKTQGSPVCGHWEAAIGAVLKAARP